MARPTPAFSLGAAIGTGATALYLVGAARAFGYDSAVTVHNFVRTKSLADPFTRQVVFNNHPLFSFLEHLVYSVTGSSSEVAMRAIPAVAAGLVIGIAAWWVARRWGALSGLATGMVLATNPVLISTAREVRGYSLLLLMATLYACLVLSPAPVTRRRLVITSVVIAAGIGTHLYMVMPLALGATWQAASGRFDRGWRLATAVGLVLGLSAYVGMLGEFGRGGREFRATFPRDLVWDLLGGTAVAVAASGALLVMAPAWDSELRNRSFRLVVGAGLVMVAAAWFVAPTDLYPRFFLWLVPVVAVAAGLAVRRQPWTFLLVVTVVLSAMDPQLDQWSEDSIPSRQIAHALRATDRVCGLGYAFEAYQVYDPAAHPITPEEVDQCDAVVVLSAMRFEPLIMEAAAHRRLRCEFRQGAVLLLRIGDRCP